MLIFALTLFGSGILALLFVLLLNTFVKVQNQHTNTNKKRLQPGKSRVDIDASGVVSKDRLERLRKSIKFETIAFSKTDIRYSALEEFVNFIRQEFPTVHQSELVTFTTFEKYSQLYYVKGSDSSLKPYLLTAHFDVVPVEDETLWEVPPFSGDEKNGFIYGRGSMDDKQMVLAILEATEELLKSNFKPTRGFYMAFGHNEEVEGSGAVAMAKSLCEKNIELEFILDEGMVILNSPFPGLSQDVALVGVAEKGACILELSVTKDGGHASMPEKESAIGILCSAVSKLEKNPQPIRFGTGPKKAMLQMVAPHMTFLLRVVLSNLWLFGRLVCRILQAKPATNGVIRSTTAVTMFKAGVKANVLSPTATVTINHRIHPGQTVDEVLEHDRRVINDNRVKLTLLTRYEPVPVSPYHANSLGFRAISDSVRNVFPDVSLVVPGLMIANSDSRHYRNLTKSIYRFCPMRLQHSDLRRFHGVDERISCRNYIELIEFYKEVITNADSSNL